MFERWMMRYLVKRGWVVFYLDEYARQCNKDTCWLGMWEIDRLKKKKGKLEKDLPHALRGIDHDRN